MQKFTALLYGIFAAVLAVGGVGFGISYWFESRFGASSVLMFWGSIGFCLAMFIGVLIANLVQRTTLNGIIDFQAADDRGEIARRAVEKEKIKGQNRYDQDVRRAAIVLAKTHAGTLVERQRLEDTRHRIAADDADSWYALPDNVEVSDDDEEWR